MPNNKKKTNNNNPQAEVERLKTQNQALQDRVTNQRRIISETVPNHAERIGKLSKVRDMSVAARAMGDGLNTMGQNPRGRAVTASGGMLSTREVNLLWRELGSTDDGRNFATAALHPCCENLPPVQGIPDRSAQPIATPSYRNTSSIAKPAAIATDTWDCQVVMIPIPEVDYVWRARSNASTDWSSWNLVRPSAFPGDAVGTGKTLGTSGYSKYRMMGRGYTIHHLASATTNQGLVVAGQVSGTVLDYVSQTTSAGSAAGNDTVIQTNFTLPSGPQQLTQQDNLTTEWEAIHGTYMPLRFDQTVELYKQCGDGGIATFEGALSCPDHFVTLQSALQEGGVVTGFDEITSSPDTTFNAPEDLPSAIEMIYAASQACNQLIGVQFFLGLDKAATLQVKSRMHIEATALPDGYSIQPFVHSSPVFDDTAMNMVAKVAQVQKHCYYAEYNDLGKMMKSIWNAIWPIGKYAATGLLSALPVIGGPLAATASKVNNPFRGSDWWSNL